MVRNVAAYTSSTWSRIKEQLRASHTGRSQSKRPAPTPVTLSDARASRYLPYTPRNKAAIAPPEATGFITNETVPEVIHEERRPVKGPASAAVGRPLGLRGLSGWDGLGVTGAGGIGRFWGEATLG